MRRMRARVREVTGIASNFYGTVTPEGDIEKGDRIADPVSLELEEAEDGVLILGLDANDKVTSDTWFETVELAMEFASRAYRVDEADWRDVIESSKT